MLLYDNKQSTDILSPSVVWINTIQYPPSWVKWRIRYIWREIAPWCLASIQTNTDFFSQLHSERFPWRLSIQTRKQINTDSSHTRSHTLTHSSLCWTQVVFMHTRPFGLIHSTLYDCVVSIWVRKDVKQRLEGRYTLELIFLSVNFGYLVKHAIESQNTPGNNWLKECGKYNHSERIRSTSTEILTDLRSWNCKFTYRRYANLLP